MPTLTREENDAQEAALDKLWGKKRSSRFAQLARDEGTKLAGHDTELAKRIYKALGRRVTAFRTLDDLLAAMPPYMHISADDLAAILSGSRQPDRLQLRHMAVYCHLPVHDLEAAIPAATPVAIRGYSRRSAKTGELSAGEWFDKAMDARAARRAAYRELSKGSVERVLIREGQIKQNGGTFSQDSIKRLGAYFAQRAPMPVGVGQLSIRDRVGADGKAELVTAFQIDAGVLKTLSI